MKTIDTTITAVITAMILVISLVVCIQAEDSVIRITAEPKSVSAFVGDRVTFTVAASGQSNSVLDYRWYYAIEKRSDGTLLQSSEMSGNLPGYYSSVGTSLSMTITNDMLDAEKKYSVYCIISDSAGNVVKSEKAYLTALDVSDFTFNLAYTPAGLIDAYVGSETILSVTATIPEPKLGTLSYQWYASTTAVFSDAEKLQGENKPYIMIATDRPGARYYYCVVINTVYGKSFSSGTGVTAAYAKAVVRSDPSAINNTLTFSDVTADAWYAKGLSLAFGSGLLNGRSADRFVPDGTVTAAEAVKIASCLSQLANNGLVSLTNGEPWYATYEAYAKANQIADLELTKGANQPVTRAQLVSLLYKALPSEWYERVLSIRDGAITDVGKGNPYSDAIYAFFRAGILTGYEDASFRPDTNITRAETAVILSRIIDASTRSTSK